MAKLINDRMAKAVKKRALGRGLSALIKETNPEVDSVEDEGADEVVGNMAEIAISNIVVNPNQPRTKFDEDKLKELSSSIRSLGIIQPITVRKVGYDKYQIVSGERRYRASRLAGLTKIPAYIRIANDGEMLQMALVENIQRHNLDPIEVALSYQRLIDELGITQEELSTSVGKKRSTIANYLRLLKLDPLIQAGMRDGMISMGHGRALVNIDNEQIQFDIYQNIIKDSLSVRQLEALIKQIKEGGELNEGEKEEVEPENPKEEFNISEKYSNFMSNLSTHIGSKVDVKLGKNGKGKLIIDFDTDDDFERIKNLLQ